MSAAEGSPTLNLNQVEAQEIQQHTFASGIKVAGGWASLARAHGGVKVLTLSPGGLKGLPFLLCCCGSLPAHASTAGATNPYGAESGHGVGYGASNDPAYPAQQAGGATDLGGPLCWLLGACPREGNGVGRGSGGGSSLWCQPAVEARAG